MRAILTLAILIGVIFYIYTRVLHPKPHYHLKMDVPYYNAPIINKLPFDESLYIQGLAFISSRVAVISSGGYGHSFIRLQDIQKNRLIKELAVSKKVFAEGVTVFEHQIIQLTWKAGMAYVFDYKLNLLKKWHYEGQGWGLTSDYYNLIMSNGTSMITFRSPKDFHVVRSIQVRAKGKPVTRINELEYLHGQIYANILSTDQIILIDAVTGEVKQQWSLEKMSKQIRQDHPKAEALNGIGYDYKNHWMYITGKHWPWIFRVGL